MIPKVVDMIPKVVVMHGFQWFAVKRLEEVVLQVSTLNHWSFVINDVT